MTDLPPPLSPVPPTASRSRGRGLRIALAVSVALNLAVIGLVAGAMLRDGPHGRFVRELDLGPFTEAFSPSDRAALRNDFMGQGGGFRALRDQIRADGMALVEVLRQEPLDRARLDALMQNQQDRIAARMTLGRDLVTARIAAMSPGDRRAFADRLEEALRRGPRGRD